MPVPRPPGARPTGPPGTGAARPWPPWLVNPATLRGSTSGRSWMLVVVLLCVLGLALLVTGTVILVQRSLDRPSPTGTPAPTSGPPPGSQTSGAGPSAQIPGGLPSVSPRTLEHRNHVQVERELRSLGFTVTTVFDSSADGKPGEVVRAVPNTNGHVLLVVVPDDEKNDNNLRTQ